MEANEYETRIIILIGLPGSGKSSLSLAIKNYFTKYQSSMEVQVIEYDQITKSLTTEKSKDKETESEMKSWLDNVQVWKETRSHALHLLEKHLSEMKRRCNRGVLIPRSIVIMDDNFYLRSMRREIYKTCQNFISNCHDVIGKIGLTFVHVDTNLQQCILNNEMRNNTEEYIPRETIIKMSRSIEPPNVERATIERLSLSTSKFSTDPMSQMPLSFYQTLDTLTNESINVHNIKPNDVKSEAELEKERNITRSSMMHKTDLILRGLVGRTCKRDKSLARTANEVRKYVVANFPNQNELVPDMERLEEWIEAKYNDELNKRTTTHRL